MLLLCHVKQALYFTTVAVLCLMYYCAMYSRLSTSLPWQYCVLTLSMYHVQQALYFTTVAVLCSHIIIVPCTAGSLLHYRSSTVFSRYYCTMYSRLSTSLPQQYCVSCYYCAMYSRLSTSLPQQYCVLTLLLYHVHQALYFTTVAVLCLTLLLYHVQQALYFTTVAVLCSHVIIVPCTTGSLLHYRSSTVFSRYQCTMYNRLSTSLPQQYCVLTLLLYHVQQALYFTTVAVLCSHVIIVPCIAGSLLHYRSSTVFSRYYCIMYSRLSTSLPQQYCVLTLLLHHV